MAQAGFTPIQLYRTTTASAQPSAGNLAAGELAINLTDKKLYAKDASNNVFLLADASSGGTTAANLAGGAAGSLPYQSGANATTFLGIGAANRVLTSSGTAPQWVTSLTGLTGVSSSSITNTSLTATRLVYSTTGGAQTDSANLTFDGTSLTINGSPNLILSSSGIERGRIVTGTGAVELMAGSTTTPTISMASNVATFTNNPVLSGGTANGVLYLDGSKVATSGSALTFDGTNLGLGTASPAVYTANSRLLQIDGGANAAEFKLTNSTTGSAGVDGTLFQLNGSAFYLWNLENSFLSFGVNNAEQMRLTSTGLGIGTSSPLTRLNPQADNTTNDSGQVIISGSTNSNKRLSLGFHTTSNYGFIQSLIAGDNYYSLVLQGNGGNLGIGTSSPNSKFEVQASAGEISRFSTAAGYRLHIYANASGSAGSGIQSQNSDLRLSAFDSATNIRFFTGNGSTETERMRIDSSGNLGLGVTPSAWQSTRKALQVGSSSSLHNVGNNTFVGNNFYSDGTSRYLTTGFAGLYGQESDGAHKFYTAPSGTAGNAIGFTQAMTLDASGNLGVGTTTLNVGTYGKAITLAATASAYGGLELSGTTGGAIDFQTSQSTRQVQLLGNSNGFLMLTNGGSGLTERARITSGGSLVVGTAALATTATDGFLYVPTCAGTPTGTPTTQTGTAPIVVDTTNNKLYFYSGGQWRDAGP